MTANIATLVKTATLSFAKKMYLTTNTEDDNHKPRLRVLLFNNEVEDVSAQDYQEFEEKLNAKLKPSGGSKFAKPLQEIVNHIN
jgi:hypothetical protein